MEHPTNSDRSQVRRLSKRGAYDRPTIYQILDEGFVCHVGFVVDQQPYVIPTLYVRIDDSLFFHGSPASRMLQVLQQGVEASVAVTLLDGLVLARSAFHHSVNYRSVVLFGRAAAISEPQRQALILERLMERVVPGRWADVRGPTSEELRRTLVLEFQIEEASAKIRTGPPIDDEEDYALPIWAGVIPLKLVAESPVNDPRSPVEIRPPTYAVEYNHLHEREKS